MTYANFPGAGWWAIGDLEFRFLLREVLTWPVAWLGPDSTLWFEAMEDIDA